MLFLISTNLNYKIPHKVIQLFLFTVTLIVFSCIGSDFQISNLFYIIRDYLVPMSNIILVLFLIRNGVNADKFLKEFYYFWVIFFFFTTILGLIYPQTNLAVVGVSDDGPDSLRIGSIVTNPNTFGYICCILYSMGIGIYLQKKRLIDLICISILLLLVILTTSRSSLLLIIGITFFVLYYYRKYYNFETLLKSIIAIITLCVVIILVMYYFNKLDNLIYERFYIERLVSDKNRFALWESIIDEFRCDSCVTRALFGMGATIFSRNNPDGWLEADNYYLKIFLEFGLFGLTLYISAIFYILFKAKALARISLAYNHEIYPNIILFTLLFILLLAGFTSTILDVYPLNYLIFIIAGLCILVFQERGNK